MQSRRTGRDMGFAESGFRPTALSDGHAPPLPALPALPALSAIRYLFTALFGEPFPFREQLSKFIGHLLQFQTDGCSRITVVLTLEGSHQFVLSALERDDSLL